jgi:hypothetical protein
VGDGMREEYRTAAEEWWARLDDAAPVRFA